ncbi:hypothetical protein OO013_07015 [Mangrovivirga sp. M17]|uniref:Uncharacterized protein n=1 Tax=Mangrovivirga halotolerans TaxID=2993936 RepID=A0ABT3RQJ1_9BACT|nr:hypothetical protein [Mangrovivirga halotolerans]MCX2743608.1 hypothetical protein [Mangrovivirga halotolerans]
MIFKNNLAYTALVAIILLLSSCLDNPVFVFDPIEPGLPIYTQRGTDVAGAIINDSIWNSEQEVNGGLIWNEKEFIPVICDTINNRLTFVFPGYIINYQNDTKTRQEIIVNLETNRIKSFEDLPLLDQTKFDLSNQFHYAYLVNQEVYDKYNNYHYYFENYYEHLLDSSVDFKPINQIGNFNIRRLSGQEDFIFAGTFGFEYEDSLNIKNTVYHGRFDFTLLKSGFFYK